jgi:hypothetical protein
MKRSLILSNTRVELRRKHAGYPTEKTILKWVEDFLNELSIVHSSQIRPWQKEYFISMLKSSGTLSRDEILQARSALLFLFDKVLRKNTGLSLNQSHEEAETEPGVFRITG